MTGYLSRRGPEHIEFVRDFWANRGLVEGLTFDYYDLPVDDAKLNLILAKEKRQSIFESKSIHWVIEKEANRYGFLSLTGYSKANNHVNLSIAMSRINSMIATKAVDEAVRFARDELKIKKIILKIHSKNRRAISSAQKYGFELEGVLKCEYRKFSGEYIDITRMGLIL